MTATLDHLNDTPFVAEPAPAPAETTYRLVISHGTFGVPEALKLDGPTGLHIGDEVNALVRIRVTGTSEREPLSSYDTHTVTTDAKIVEFIEIDGAVVNTPSPAIAEKAQRVEKAKRTDWVLRGFLILCGAFLVLSVLGALAGCSSEPVALPAATAAASPQAAPAIAAQDTCRATARRVFTAVAADKMTSEQGQTEVDKGCAGVDATNRKAILDSERVKALAAWADSATPTAG